MKTKVIQIRSPGDVAAAAAQGALALQEGLLVGFATETVYGIAANAANAATMERLRELKSRPTRSFSVHLGRPQDAFRYVAHMPMPARMIIRKGWPGPVTLLAPTGGKLADAALGGAELYGRLVQDDTIGLRCPDEPVTIAMLQQAAVPVVAPSANLAGAPSPRSAQDVLAALDGKIDLLLDSGPTRLGVDSTIVHVGADGWKIVRAGAVDAASVRRLATCTVLFVCTGNTCRSPMAAGLAVKVLCDELHCRPAELADRGWSVLSAGVYAGGESPATPEAAAAARKLGADISGHRSRKLTSELIHGADMIFCMTDLHVEEVCSLSPPDADKVQRLDPAGEIPDPIGQSQDVYLRTGRRILQAVKDALHTRMP